MADLASDNFPVDGGLGANWTTQTTATDPTIRSGVVEDFATAGATSHAMYTAITWPENQYAYLTVVNCATSNGRSVSLWLRGQTAAVTGYIFDVLGPLGATTQLRIRRFSAGAGSTLADSGATETVSAGAILRAEVLNGDVKLYIDGNLRLSATDGSPLSGGSPGIGVTSNSVLSEAQLDTWGAGDLSATTITGLGRRHQGFMYGRP